LSLAGIEVTSNEGFYGQLLFLEIWYKQVVEAYELSNSYIKEILLV
jgi:hypothetical protein